MAQTGVQLPYIQTPTPTVGPYAPTIGGYTAPGVPTATVGPYTVGTVPPAGAPSTPVVTGTPAHGLVDMKRFSALQAMIIATFVFLLIALAFLVYLAITDTEYRTDFPAGDTFNYQLVNGFALAFGLLGIILIFVLVGIGASRKRFLVAQPSGIPQTVTYTAGTQFQPQGKRQ